MRLYWRNGIAYVSLPGEKRISLRTRNEEEAKRIFKRMRKEALLGNVIKLDRSANVFLFDFRDEYLKESCKSESTALIDKKSFTTLCDHIGNIPLKSITDKRLDKLQRDLLKEGRKATGINMMSRHLRSAFNTAVDWGYLTASPYNKVKKLKEDELPPRFLSENELQRIHAALKGDFADLINLYLLTGMRRSELCLLEKRHIDLDRGICMVKGKGRWRTVRLSLKAREILKPRLWGNGRVFTKWTPDAITRRWSRLMTKLGIERCRLHDLRHTAASYMVMAGIDLRTVQEFLGHSQITTTQIYSHLSEEHVQGAVDKLEKSLTFRTAGKPKVVSSK